MRDSEPLGPLAERVDYAFRATAAVLTPAGRGAVATIRVVGDISILDEGLPAIFRAANGRPLAEQSPGRVVFGQWGDVHAEDIVVCRREPDVAEIHCHGGTAAVGRILHDLRSRGCAIQTWFEHETARHDLLAAECLDALSRAPTRRTAEILLDQYSGTLRAAFETLRNTVDPIEVAHRAEELLKWSCFGLHLTQPWKVVVTGRPNVGKSSLVNALVGYARSIVYNEPGTTRDVVTAITAFDGWPMEVADTAGIRETAGPIETAGIELARTHLAAADCRVIVLDTSRPPEPEDQQLLAEWSGGLIVAHKSDLPDLWRHEVPAGAIAVSSKTGQGIDRLVAAILERLIPAVPAIDTAIPITARQCDVLGRLANNTQEDPVRFASITFGELFYEAQ